MTDLAEARIGTALHAEEEILERGRRVLRMEAGRPLRA
jgi:hypothetical protein